MDAQILSFLGLWLLQPNKIPESPTYPTTMIIHSSDGSVTAPAESISKWGIPSHHDAQQAEEAAKIVLLQRLVWVRYKSHWWPALLYHSYTELQEQVTEEMTTALKAQFAIAIMRQMQDNRKIKVARLLGMPSLEVVEAKKGDYHEFYSMLPKMLPRALNKSRYGKEISLFLNLHRALDQVEAIIGEVWAEKFAIVPTMDSCSWLRRGKEQVGHSEDEVYPVKVTYFRELQGDERDASSIMPLASSDDRDKTIPALGPQNSLISTRVLPPTRRTCNKIKRSSRKEEMARKDSYKSNEKVKAQRSDRRDDASLEGPTYKKREVREPTPTHDVFTMIPSHIENNSRESDSTSDSNSSMIEQHEKHRRPPQRKPIRKKPIPEWTELKPTKKTTLDESHRRSKILSSDLDSLASSQIDERLKETEKMLREVLKKKKQAGGRRRRRRNNRRLYPSAQVSMAPVQRAFEQMEPFRDLDDYGDDLDLGADLAEFKTTLHKPKKLPVENTNAGHGDDMIGFFDRIEKFFVGQAPHHEIEVPIFEILPGLEGDDILAGLSADIRHLMAEKKTLSREDIMKLLQEAEDGIMAMGPSDTLTMDDISTLSPNDRRPTSKIADTPFWQRMVCQ